MPSANHPVARSPEDQRDREDEDAAVPSGLLAALVDYFDPEQVILFGSRARHAAGRDSDIDLAVIVGDDAPQHLLSWRAANEARRRHRGAIDILPYRAGTFAESATIVGSLPWSIATEGRVVYERKAV